MARFWQSKIGKAVLLFIVPTNFGFTVVDEMINELFSFKEAGSQLCEQRFHPELQTFGAITVVVFTTDEESWEAVED